MAPDEMPTSGELMRAIERVGQELADMRRDLSTNYVRQDVQARNDLAYDQRIKTVDDRHTAVVARLDAAESNQVALRRQIVGAGLSIISAVVIAFILYAVHVK